MSWIRRDFVASAIEDVEGRIEEREGKSDWGRVEEKRTPLSEEEVERAEVIGGREGAGGGGAGGWRPMRCSKVATSGLFATAYLTSGLICEGKMEFKYTKIALEIIVHSLLPSTLQLWSEQPGTPQFSISLS